MLLPSRGRSDFLLTRVDPADVLADADSEKAGPHHWQPVQFSLHGFRALGFKYERDRQGLELNVPFAQTFFAISRPQAVQV